MLAARWASRPPLCFDSHQRLDSKRQSGGDARGLFGHHLPHQMTRFFTGRGWWWCRGRRTLAEYAGGYTDMRPARRGRGARDVGKPAGPRPARPAGAWPKRQAPAELQRQIRARDPAGEIAALQAEIRAAQERLGDPGSTPGPQGFMRPAALRRAQPPRGAEDKWLSSRSCAGSAADSASFAKRSRFQRFRR